MEQKINTKGLIAAALMAGIITIIVIITSYIPFIYMFRIFILPIPVAIIYYMHGSKYSIGCVGVSILLTSMLLSPVVAITSGITYSIVGITLGYCLRNKRKPYNTLIYLIIACVVSIIVEVWVAGIFIGNSNLFRFVKEQLIILIDNYNTSIESTKNLYTSMGASAAQIQALDQASSSINIDVLQMLLPGSIFIYGFFQSYISYMLTNQVLKRLNCRENENLVFSEFYISNLFGAALIATMCIGIIISSRGITWGLFLYNATMILAICVLTINGLAAVYYFFMRKTKMPKIQSSIIVGIVLIIGLFKFFSVIGFVEMMFDFRKLDPHRIRKV